MNTSKLLLLWEVQNESLPLKLDLFPGSGFSVIFSSILKKIFVQLSVPN